MSATTGGAFKAWLEGLGLGVAVYRDGAPVGAGDTLLASYPYVVVQEAISQTDAMHGDYADPAAHLATTELVQVDLYQQARVTTSTPGRAANAEAYTLADTLAAALHGGLGIRTFAPWRVYGVTVQGAQRFPAKDNVVRHAWTVAVHRDTKRT